MAEILAVCKSEKKGTRKKNVGGGILKKDSGLLGDAHAGSDREVSLLASEEIEKFKKKFIKNIAVSNIRVIKNDN